MKHVLLAALFVLAFVAAAMSQTAGDPNEGTRLSKGSGNTLMLSWWGQEGRTYFVQYSEDLVTWLYCPDIVGLGANALLSYGVTRPGGNPFFLRLKYTDAPAGNPQTADFDDDGIGNSEELLAGTDPFRAGPAVTLTAPSWAALAN